MAEEKKTVKRARKKKVVGSVAVPVEGLADESGSGDIAVKVVEPAVKPEAAVKAEDMAWNPLKGGRAI